MRSKITFVDPYNPDPEVITQQVTACGGWEKYNGQLYYFNPEVDDYPLIEADSVWEDFETEAGIKIFNNREVNTGFLPSTMLFMKTRREEADNQGPDSDNQPYLDHASQLEKDLGSFQGTKKAQKIIVIEYDEEKPEFQPYAIQNNDKLFESTEKSVEARIIKGFSVPKELVSQDKAGGLNNNGGDKKEAIREFTNTTAPDRQELSEVFAEIFSHWYTAITPANWNILPVPAEVADDAPGIKAGTSINQVLASNMPAANKIAILMHAYGFTEGDARAMAPEGGYALGSTSARSTPQTTKEATA